jgi:hypothetical protein
MQYLNKLTLFSLMLFSSVLIFSCSKETGPAGATGATGPQGAQGPAYTGVFTGFINLYDQYGNKVTTNLSTVKVTIDGTTISTKTDATGKYTISNLSTGNYTLTFTDTTNVYAPSKLQEVQLVSGTVEHDVKLSAIPNFTLTSFSARDTTIASTNFIKLTVTPTSTDPQARTVAAYFNSTSSVTSSPESSLGVYTVNIKANAATGTLLIYQSDFMNLGINSGSTVYFMAYPAASNFASSSDYEDYNNGRYYFNAVSASGLAANASVQ